MKEVKAPGRDDVPDYGVRMRRMADLVAAHAMPLADVSLYLDVPLSTIEKIRASGKGPRCFKIGRRLYVRQADLRTWLDQMSAEAAA